MYKLYVITIQMWYDNFGAKKTSPVCLDLHLKMFFRSIDIDRYVKLVQLNMVTWEIWSGTFRLVCFWLASPCFLSIVISELQLRYKSSLEEWELSHTYCFQLKMLIFILTLWFGLVTQIHVSIIIILCSVDSSDVNAQSTPL